jgi:hypothetical protein
VLIAGAGITISVLTIFGRQAHDPIQSDIRKLERVTIPRAEVEYRDAATIQRLGGLENDVRWLREQREHDLQRQIDRLEAVARPMK